jgi:hypothetical protein
MKLPTITLIRHYIVDMLSENVDVGNRVFEARPNSPLFLDELPCINVHFTSEVISPSSGSKYYAKEHERVVDTIVTVCVENQLKKNENFLKTQRGQDYLDVLAQQVEDSFIGDRFFSKRLTDFDPNDNYDGLACGNKLNDIVVYDIESETNKTIIGKVLRFQVRYVGRSWDHKRYPWFTDIGLEQTPG